MPLNVLRTQDTPDDKVLHGQKTARDPSGQPQHIFFSFQEHPEKDDTTDPLRAAMQSHLPERTAETKSKAGSSHLLLSTLLNCP